MSRKKLLIYAHYYTPDVASTGQILQDQAEGMKEEFDVTVICTVPSYTGKIDEKYKDKWIYKEEINDVKVIRIRVPEFSKSSKVSRVKNLLAYFKGAKKATKMVGEQDYVFTISQPPILGGMLGVYGKKKLRTEEGKHPKFIYCIQDFNPEQTMAVGYVRIPFITKIMMAYDKHTCRKSDLIITVGRDLVETLKNRFAKEQVPRYALINNWIDEKEIYPLSSDNSGVIEFKKQYDLEGKFIIMYSGNIGLYYDLENLIKIIAKFNKVKTKDGRDVVFAFVGAGSVLDKLIEFKNENKLENVYFIPYQDKEELIYSLNAADVHWCVNAKGIKGVSCPSKFYGIAGVAKPVLGVLEAGSEIEMLIAETRCGRVSEPGDYDDVEKNIAWFIEHAESHELSEMGQRGHEYLMNHLTKDISIGKYIESISNC